MKKILSIILLGLLTTSMTIFANGAKEEVATNKPITISVLTRWSGDAPTDIAFRKRLAEYQAMHPEVIIQDISVSDENSFDEKFRTGLSSGAVPNIYQNYGCASTRAYAENGVNVNLEPFFEEDPEWKNAFYDSYFSNWQYDGIEGTYGVPYESGPIPLFYNKALFKKYGLTPPVTIEEMLEDGKVFMENGIVPFSLGAKDSYRGGHLFNHLFYKRFGVAASHILGSDEFKYTDPEMIDLFQKIKDMQETGFLGSDILAGDTAYERALFNNSKTAMHIDGSWYIDEAKITDIANVMGVIKFPYYEDYPEYQNDSFGGPMAGLSVSAFASEAEQRASIDLLKFITSKEHFEAMQDVGMIAVPVKGTVNKNLTQIDKEYNAAADMIKNYGTDVQRYDPANQLLDTARNAIQGLFAGMDATAVAQQIQDEVDSSRE